MTNLERWGWDAVWAAAAELEGVAAVEYGRVIEQERDRWIVALAAGPSPARITSASFPGLYPVAGDWVATRPGPMPSDPASIVGVLPRRSAISRGAAGDGTTEQVLAANVDVVWIVQGLDKPINLRSIERYLAIAWESGAIPEIVLTKADLTGDAENPVDDLGQTGIGVDVHLVSIEQPDSIRDLRTKLKAGRTVALLGPSGAGKSTLINALAETSVAATGPVRAADRKGRHTTTRRELFQLPGGALLLDTPGLRELRVWDLGEGLQHAFPEIDDLSAACHYRDCRHESEPGCAVLAAAESGDLDPHRLASFRKLAAEAAYVQRTVDPEARALAVSRHKTAMKTLKYHPKYER
jgi:ribosome biogenesis GTPase / thiamine phosphate phosphatase